MKNDIDSNQECFRDSFFSEAINNSFDEKYKPLISLYLIYVWRGCSLSRNAGITGKSEPNAALLSLSSYEAVLGLIQLIRIGYLSDAMIIGRALIERIAIVGYINENRELIKRYFAGGYTPYNDALAWAKKNALPNWMHLYGTFSGVTHSRLEGLAGNINNRTPICMEFKKIYNDDLDNGPDLTEELLSLVLYSLMALDPYALQLINEKEIIPFPSDPVIAESLGKENLLKIQSFLQEFIKRFETRSTAISNK